MNNHRNAPIVEDLQAVRLNDIRRAGALTPGSIYKFNGNIEFRAMNGYALVNAHRVEYGRTRHGWCPDQHQLWFRCACGALAGVLYIAPGGRIGCRLCFRALHISTRTSAPDRAFNRARKIRDRLAKWLGITLDPRNLTFPPKPAWMLDKRYVRLAADHAELIERAQVGLAQKFAMPYERKHAPRPLFKVGAKPAIRKAARQAEQEAQRTAQAEAEIIAREKYERAIMLHQREQAQRPKYPIDPRS